MEYAPPPHVELTDEETMLCDQIPSSLDQSESWESIADAMGALFKSLFERNAIPEVRLRVFADPKLAETHHKSPKQVFESNGVCGDDIYRHPDFIKYLRYFINGPDLPSPAIEGLCRILKDDKGTSGMVRDQVNRYVRSSVRKYDLDRQSAATHFYRLAVELGIGHRSHGIRAAVMKTRSTRSKNRMHSTRVDV